MTIKNGIKFGIGFCIGKAVVLCTTQMLIDCLKGQLKKIEDSEQTENKDVEVE